MKIILTDHTKKRMRERDINISNIKETIDIPDYTIRKNGKIEALKTMNNKSLKVVYIEKGKFIKIISVMWR